jgi:hypothetical protein
MDRKRCRHCQSFFLPNPRIKNQRYCSRPACQQARKTSWQRNKMRHDPDYQADHRDAQKSWIKHHPDYWKNYRTQHPAYVQTNRRKQKKRDRKRRWKNLAKMDALRPFSFIKSGTYFIAPDLAKMDALAQKIFIIPASWTPRGSSCKEGLDRL